MSTCETEKANSRHLDKEIIFFFVKERFRRLENNFADGCRRRKEQTNKTAAVF